MLRAAAWVAAIALVVAGGGPASIAGGHHRGHHRAAAVSDDKPAVADKPGAGDPPAADDQPLIDHMPVSDDPAPASDTPTDATPTDGTLTDGAPTELLPIPDRDGVPLDQTYPALDGWVHPVVNSDELTPVRWQRKFLAPRPGASSHPGCGRRHCGLDLAGPRGRTVVSVTTGTVIHIERRRNGKDGLSGRYVRIAHADGVFTSYMHLDEIAPGLEEGAHVDAGQFIGRLGKTGIRHGDPHLHFNLELPGDDGSTQWDKTRFIDATPFLQRARVIPDPVGRKKNEPPRQS